MIASSRSYAIGMAHFQMAGGFLTMVVSLGAYVLLVLVVTGLYFYGESGRYTATLPATSVDVLLVMQCVGLLLLGSNRISTAVRKDLSSRMIESHRLMPIPSWRAIAGYIF